MKTINFEIIEKNIKKLLDENKKIMLVLKDNAYNFGIEEVARIAINLGVKYFAVKNVVEANKIRMLSKDSVILILNKTNTNIYEIKRNGYLLSVENEEQRDFCLNNKICYHLKINSQMNRFGISNNDIDKYITPFLSGLFLHVPTDDLKENEYEIKKMEELVEKYNLKDIDIHIGGTNCLKNNNKYIYRIASDIYKDSISLTGEIVSVRKIKEGESVGYNHDFVAKKDCLIGICNLGYVDGLSRINKDNYVYINNNKYFFIGLKCMDCSFILIDENVNVNDNVEVIGQNISLEIFCENNEIIKHQAYLILK